MAIKLCKEHNDSLHIIQQSIYICAYIRIARTNPIDSFVLCLNVVMIGDSGEFRTLQFHFIRSLTRHITL